MLQFDVMFDVNFKFILYNMNNVELKHYKIRKQLFVKLENIFPTIVLFFVLHTLVLPYLCSNMAFSFYFQEDTSNHTNNRQILMLNHSDHAKTESTLVVVILTAPRARDTSYLHQTLDSVLEQVAAAGQNHQVYVCSGEI